jgi:hypothetical protein
VCLDYYRSLSCVGVVHTWNGVEYGQIGGYHVQRGDGSTVSPQVGHFATKWYSGRKIGERFQEHSRGVELRLVLGEEREADR